VIRSHTVGGRLLAFAMLVVSGCGRLRFDPVDTAGADRDATSIGDATSNGDATPSDAFLAVGGDTCADAIDVDLTSGSATVMFNTVGAVADYPGGCGCAGIPELVFRVRNPTTSSVRIACTAGGGPIALFTRNSAACPDLAGPNCSNGSCPGYTGVYNAGEGYYYALCRSSSLATATVTFTNQ
jgi:hypothetical protein